MKIFAFILLSLMIVTAGCIKAEPELTINKDGSGVLNLDYSISEQAIIYLKGILKLEQQVAMQAGKTGMESRPNALVRLFYDPDENQIREEFNKYQKYGIVLDNLKIETRDIRRHIQMRVMFSSLANAARTDLFTEYGFSFSRDSDGNYVLCRTPEKNGKKKTPRISNAEVTNLLTPILAGFRVAIKVNTPARILETNASSKSPHTASWHFDFDENPNAVSEIQSWDMRIVFDGKDPDLTKINQPAPPNIGKKITNY